MMAQACRVAVLAGLAVLVCATPPAAAVTFLELAGSPHSRHPYTTRVWPTGPSDSYFNPCLMLDEPSTVFVGPFAFVRNLNVSYDARPSDAAVPGMAQGALPRARGSRDLGGAGFHIGQGNHTQIIPGRLAMGFYLLLAGDAFSSQGGFFPDEREQFFSNSLQFELLGDRTDAVGFSFAVSGRPLDWLAVGAGIGLSFSTTVRETAYVADGATPSDALLQTSSDLAIRVAPHFSIVATPLDGLRLTTTVHMPFESGSDVGTTVRTRQGDGVEEFTREAEFTYGYLPWRVALGASWTFGEGTEETPTDAPVWSVAATALWANWSAYRDRNGERPSPEWSDTISVAVGGDLVWGRHAVGLDMLWAPSPVPDQTGRTSYVDNDRIGAAAGYDLTFELGDVTLIAGAHVHFQGLLSRSVRKSASAAEPVLDEAPDMAGVQTNSPGYPGYSSDGWLLSAGATLRVQF